MATAESSDAPRSRSGLLRILGFWDGVAVVVGVTIGSGILRTPGIVAGQLGRPALIAAIWVLGALLALGSALCLAELVAQLPRVGGKYVYAREAFGPLTGFVAGWSEIVSRGMTAAAKCVVIGEYLVLLTGRGSVRGLALAAALAFAALHWSGLRPVRAFQNTATVVKVAILLGVSALAFALGPGFDWDLPPAAPRTPLGALAAVAIAFQVISFTYYGYDEATKLGEEMRDPQRRLPRVLATGVLVVTAIYLLVNAAFLYVLTPAEMAGSALVAADVASRLAGGSVGALVTVGALVVLAGSLNVNFLTLPRVGLAMAQDGLAPGPMTRVSGGGAPRVALAVATAVIVIAALVGSFQNLVLVIMSIVLLVDGAVILSLFRLRRTRPDLERPYRVPLYPVLPAAVLAVYAALLAGIAVSIPWVVGLAVAVLALLAIVGVPFARRSKAVTSEAGSW